MAASLSAITLTGADEAVDLKELRELHKVSALAELGFLYWPELQGTPRFPSQDWIKLALKQCPHGAKSLHLCSSAVEGFVAGDLEILSLAKLFNRVQLNFIAKAASFTPEELSEAIMHFGRPVITQHNAANREFNFKVAAPNHQLLLDSSMGQGKLPDIWPPVVAGRKCSYAGGLSPSNLHYQLPRIFKAAGNNRISIDLESGLRDISNNFVMGKARDSLIVATSLKL